MSQAVLDPQHPGEVLDEETSEGTRLEPIHSSGDDEGLGTFLPDPQQGPLPPGSDGSDGSDGFDANEPKTMAEPARLDSDAPVAELPVAELAEAAPAPRVYVPRPKPVIAPERTEAGFRTANVELEPAHSRAYYVTVRYPTATGSGPAQRVFVPADEMRHLLDAAVRTAPEPGALWRRFSRIPLERLLPSRALEDELRALLMAFEYELRR